MSYHTTFTGRFNLSRPLTLAEKNEIDAFCEKRHEPPPKGMPHCYYCDWRVSEDGTQIEEPSSDGSFYDYDKWLLLLIERFFAPWGVLLNGEMEWDGEESGDMGKLILKDSVLTVKRAKVTYE